MKQAFYYFSNTVYFHYSDFKAHTGEQEKSNSTNIAHTYTAEHECPTVV